MARTSGLAIKPDPDKFVLKTLFCAGCRKETEMKSMVLKKGAYVCRKCEGG